MDASELLAHSTWRYRSTVRCALTHRFVIRTTDEELGAHLATLVATFPADRVAEVTYSLVDGTTPGAEGLYHLFVDGHLHTTASSPAWIVSYLLWHVHRTSILSSDRFVLVHAAGITYRGLGVVLPAPMEHGKTTLVAGLVKGGGRYLTDEAVVVDPDRGVLVPFPKVLTLDPGSWEVHGDLRPDLPPSLAQAHELQWHVPVTRIRADAVADEAAPRVVIAHRYDRAARTTIRPLDRPSALLRLLENRFDLGHRGRDLRVLAEVVRGSDCFELTVGDLDRACELTLQTLADLAPRDRDRAISTTGDER